MTNSIILFSLSRNINGRIFVNNNISYKLWFFAAICFAIAGIVSKNITFISLGCVYICIGLSKKRKFIDKDDGEK